MLILLLQRRGFRILEAFVAALVFTIGACFAYELWAARPDPGGILRGFWPTTRILSDPAMLYVAIGILGATVMPHNLYLHSSIVQTRAYPRTEDGKRVPMEVKTGDKVLYGKYSGTEVTIDGEQLLILRESDILAIVK